MYSSISAIAARKEFLSHKITAALIGVVSFVASTALAAYVYIPLGFTPVPITMQTFFVLLSGALLGRRLGSLSQFLYLILGITGLPLFFSGAWGFSYILGPTGGYLLGFVAAAYAIGKLLKNRGSLPAIISALITGELIILFSGAGWLWLGLHFSLKQALYLGVFPFVPGDIIKLAAAVLICNKYLKRSKVLFY